jgi:Domain of unknown function (DUF4189)
MFFVRRFGVVGAVAAVVTICGVGVSAAERIDRGTRNIDGTSVSITVYHERGYADFENSCGSQRLTQSQLQSGAKPHNIIPCPRRSTTVPNPPHVSSGDGVRWGALAAGIKTGLFRSRVGVGSALRHSSREEAQRRAVAKCEENGVSCNVVSTFNTCGFITVSTNGSDNVVWGMGPTAQDAYNECYRRVKGGNCVTQTIGGCN